MSGLSELELCMLNLGDEPPLQKEKTWGLSYRNWTQSKEPKIISPKHSPINVPFKLCMAKQGKPKKKKKKRCKCRCREEKNQKVTLLDRSAMAQDKYMELLAIPHQYIVKKKKRHKENARVCCKCRLMPLCNPRIVQMAIPNKRYVLANWKQYQNVLPAEMIQRFDQILKSWDNLDPNIARCYFKRLQKQKRKLLRKRRKAKKCKCEAKLLKEKQRMENQINELVEEIAFYIQHEPQFMLNFQQMMVSNELLKYLDSQRVVKVKSRTTKSPYKKGIIEISDKVIKWVDRLNFLADMQPISSKEQLGEPFEFPEMIEEEEEELESEEEIEDYDEEMLEAEEKLEGAEGKLEADEDLWADEQEGLTETASETARTKEKIAGQAGQDASEEKIKAQEDEGEGAEEFLARKLLDNTKAFDYEGEEGSLYDMLKDFDEDTLEKLIKILSESTPEFLAKEIDPVGMPGVTYNMILEKLKEIRDGRLLEKEQKMLLEQKMIEWARENEPEQVDDKVLDKIHETSKILAEVFKYSVKKTRFDQGVKDKDKGKGVDDSGLGSTMMDSTVYGEDGEPIVDEIFSKVTKEDNLEAKPRMGKDEAGEGYTSGEEGEYGSDEEGADLRRRLGEGEEGEDLGGRRLGEEGEDLGGRRLGEEGEELGGRRLGEGEEGEDQGRRFGEGEGSEGRLGEGEEGEDEIAKRRRLEGDEGEEGEDEIARLRRLEDEEEGEGDYHMFEDEGFVPEGEEFEGGEEEGEGKMLPDTQTRDKDKQLGDLDQDLQRLESLIGVIKGHKPLKVFEHEPGTICCLSLKIWAVWLLEIANNAHRWTKWIEEIIRQVRYYTAVIRGDITTPSGEKRVLYKEEWRNFVKETEEKVIAWRQYSKHVKDLSQEIIDTFHGKQVKCCPKCLQDHLIKNVVVAHETLQALTEALNCAGYWQRCLDRIVEQTSRLTDVDLSKATASRASLARESSYSFIEIEELCHVPAPRRREASSESIFEIEEVCINKARDEYEILEIEPCRMPPPKRFYSIEELYQRDQAQKVTPPADAASKPKGKKKKGEKEKKGEKKGGKAGKKK